MCTKNLNYFKTASVEKVGYLRHLDLDTFKTVVIRFDGEIILFNIPKNKLTVLLIMKLFLKKIQKNGCIKILIGFSLVGI